MEYLPLGNIENQNQLKALSGGEVAQTFLQALKGLKHLHTLPDGAIVHGNIKPQNILVVSRQSAATDFWIKLTDHGLHMGETYQRPADSDAYKAPETKKGFPTSTAGDIVSSPFLHIFGQKPKLTIPM